MACISNGVCLELKKKAHKLCKKYLGGSWKHVSLEEFSIEELCGGLTNELYICSLPDNYPAINKEKKKVVLRLYGPLYDDMVSSSSALISDIVVFALLAERNVGPKLYAIFPQGRMEELLNGKSLIREEMTQPEISVKIAQRMAEYHRLELPLCKEPDFMWNTMHGWCKDVEQMYLNEHNKAVMLAKVKEMDLEQEYYFLRNYLEKVTSPGSITFCHNDIQEGNILKVSKDRHMNNDEEIELRLIDFEYSAYNYRAFDLANHFCEWMFDYKVAEPVYFSMALDQWPSKEQQLLFIRAYLGKHTFVENRPSLNEPTIEETELMDQANRFALASHFLWGLWGVVQERFLDKTNIPFSYMEYGMARLQAYQHHKKLLGLV
ncbi:choline kinase alpha-like isoform X1 [Montipora foliosa]|uniref:choline kinase alpha-like isoform X1 n=1 Tax=Montipora foliosa TaxID=591990 RepID=UPI0035F2033A